MYRRELGPNVWTVAPGGTSSIPSIPSLRFVAAGDKAEPYPAGVRELRAMSASGVYVFREASSGAWLYVGESHTGRLYGTLTRHFQAWERRKTFWRGFGGDNDPGTTYDRAKCEVAVVALDPDAAVELHDQLIRDKAPRDNIQRQMVGDDPPF